MKAAAHLLLLALACLSLTACSLEELVDKKARDAKKSCMTIAEPALSGRPNLLPPSFPTPDGVFYTAESKAGPSAIVEGFRAGKLGDLYDAYRDQLSKNGWDVTKDEHDAADAEVNFASSANTGQVKLLQECKTRVKVTLTIRPA